VVIDDQGLHIGTSNDPGPALITAAVNKALVGAGLQIKVGRPTTNVSGAAATYTAASITITLTPPGGTDSFVTILGGSSVSVVAAPSFASDFTPTAAPSSRHATTAAPASHAAAAPPTDGTPQGDVGPGLSDLPSDVAPAPVPAASPAIAAPATSPPAVGAAYPAHRVAAWWPVLALLGAFACAYFARGVPLLLIGRATAICPLVREQ
jgi:hypothetical protein